MICAGIDAGSRAIKIVLFDRAGDDVVAAGVTDQGVEQDELATRLLDRLLEERGMTRKDIRGIVATGYGRNIVRLADTTVTEITCHAVGVRYLVPEAMTVIDIGGQDSKLLRLNREGTVRDFAMNDRCAAGTGRFLEVVSERLDIPLAGLGELAAQSVRPAVISSMCVGFAETEIIGLLAAGTPREDIVAGVQGSLAARVGAMAGRKVDPPIIFAGGVAMVPGMAEALQMVLALPVTGAPDPQMTGALGAALLAARRLED